MLSEAYLILENGDVFKGISFGYDGEAVGELVFTTGMTGYLETLSDPAYYGQIVLQTFPLIGNYGVIPEDFGPGPIHLEAYIVRQWCQEPSNFRSEGNLDSFLRKHKIPGLCGIDTRALTRLLRDKGVMNARISKTPDLQGFTAKLPLEPPPLESPPLALTPLATPPLASPQTPSHSVALWDFGCTPALISRLRSRMCDLKVFSRNAMAEEILAAAPDGIVLSGGPGDPSANTRIISEIRELTDKGIPILAVGLGHQMLALALGATTSKLHFGHRGANQPVKQHSTGRSFVTTQNHGYTVDSGSLPDGAAVSHESLNDGTCEGIEYRDFPALSIQFDPTDEILEEFITQLARWKNAAK